MSFGSAPIAICSRHTSFFPDGRRWAPTHRSPMHSWWQNAPVPAMIPEATEVVSKWLPPQSMERKSQICIVMMTTNSMPPTHAAGHHFPLESELLPRPALIRLYRSKQRRRPHPKTKHPSHRLFADRPFPNPRGCSGDVPTPRSTTSTSSMFASELKTCTVPRG